MFKRTDNLRRKIITACIVGLGVLTMGPCIIETSHNFNNKEVRYNLAKSKVQELAEYDNLPGTSSSEWGSVYNQLGLNYEIRGPKEPNQKDLDNYLEKFGFFWNGKKYTNDSIR
jgi:hypothetical protein